MSSKYHQSAQLTAQNQLVQWINEAGMSEGNKKANLLRKIVEVMIHQAPQTIPLYMENVLSFVSDKSTEVKKQVIAFIEELSKKYPEHLPKIIAQLQLLVIDTVIAVQKRAIQAASIVYRNVLIWLCRSQTEVAEMQYVWEHLTKLKLLILNMIDSENEGIRTHSIKFLEEVVLLQSSSEGSDEEFCLDSIPTHLPFLKRRTLEEESEHIFELLVKFHNSQHISSVNLMACMTTLCLLAKFRPKYMPRVIQALGDLHTTLPPTLSQSQVNSVRKHLKMLVLNLIKHPSSNDMMPHLTQLLSDIGMTAQEIHKAVPKEKRNKRLNEIRGDDGPAKRFRIDSPQSNSQGSDSNSRGEFVYDDENSQHSVTKPTPTEDSIYEGLNSVENVIGLVTTTLVNHLPNSMPGGFAAAYKPIPNSGTNTQKRNLAKMLLALIRDEPTPTPTAIPPPAAPSTLSDVSTKIPLLRDDDEKVTLKNAVAKLQESTKERQIESAVSKLMEETRQEHLKEEERRNRDKEKLVPPPTPTIPKLKHRVKLLKLQELTRPIPKEIKEKLMLQAVERILRAEQDCSIGGAAQIRTKFITIFASSYTSEIRDLVLNYILEEPVNRIDLALSWLYEEYAIMQGFNRQPATPKNIHEKHGQNYNQLLCALVTHICESGEPNIENNKDVLLRKVYLESPVVTEEAVDYLKYLVTEDKVALLALDLLEELCIMRPPRAHKYVPSLVLHVLNESEEIREVALRACARVHRLATEAAKRVMEKHALVQLGFMQLPSPPPELGQGPAWTDHAYKLCLGLVMALFPQNEELIVEVARVYGCSGAEAKRCVLRCTEGPLRAAAAAATAAAAAIDFPGAHHRKDIAHRAFSKVNGLSYLESGVDMEAAATLVRQIEPLATGTHRRGVLGRLGCYSGLFQLSAMDARLQDPVLVQGTDGVGTKLKIAESMQKFDTLGQDLVAMCVNDILCAGAEPFAFLDYIACGRLQVDVATAIVKGIADACQLAGCALLGGETAEIPSMYEAGKYDLAGFAVGVVEGARQLPRRDRLRPGDLLLALPSSGPHSNGYSLVHRIMRDSGLSYRERAPFSPSGRCFGEEFLEPTALYVRALLPALRRGLVKALAHITGGGLLENVPRVLPRQLRARFDATKFDIKPVFGWLQAAGAVPDQEMLRTFNCGVGMVVIAAPESLDQLRAAVEGEMRLVGLVELRDPAGGPQVVVERFAEAMAPLRAPYAALAAPRPLSYKDSGVDIEAGDSLVSLIKPLARSTIRSGVIGGLGGFGGCFQLKAIEHEYKDPVLVVAADGVGSKLQVAQRCDRHDSIGLDLVAMCVNDVLCNGARPLTFLDYFACGALDVRVAERVVAGVAAGCRQAEAALIGGETAEMPGMYPPGVYDIAGFALGVVERSHILPKINDITVGDIIIGLPSNGVHSNGFSLIHKLMKKAGLTLEDKAPFSKEGLTLGEELIKPTRIYVASVLPALQRGVVKAVAHVTGGGLLGNLPRVIPESVRARLNAHWWHVHPVFAWIADTGAVNDEEMLRTFNCGIGMVLIVAPEDQADVMNITRSFGAMVIGTVQARPAGGARVQVDNFASALDFTRRMPLLPNKRVAVLASGNGSNLQALLEAARDPAHCLCADIVLLVTNNKDAYALKRAEAAGLPALVFNHKDYPSREEFDRAVSGALEAHKIDIVCLAGFMRILSKEFVDKWKGRLVNIHPSLLPRHPGLRAQRQCLAAGDCESGTTVHFVDHGVDTGPIITQERVPVLKDDTEETLTERIHQAEHRAYPRALRLVATGRVRLSADGELLWHP